VFGILVSWVFLLFFNAEPELKSRKKVSSQNLFNRPPKLLDQYALGHSYTGESVDKVFVRAVGASAATIFRLLPLELIIFNSI